MSNKSMRLMFEYTCDKCEAKTNYPMTIFGKGVYCPTCWKKENNITEYKPVEKRKNARTKIKIRTSEV